MAVLGMEVILGSLTFTGSLMAAGKLQEILPQRPITYKGQNIVNLGVLAVAIATRGCILVMHPGSHASFSLHRGNSSALRRADDYSHRRRGHAHGDFAAEFLRWTFRRGDGIRA